MLKVRSLLTTKIDFNTTSALEKIKVISFTNSTYPHVTASCRIAVKTGIDVKAQSMTIRGKQRLPLGSQSIAKAFWVTLAHTDTGIHTSTARGHPSGAY